MSLAYYIVLDHQEPGFETFVNGKAVAHAIDELDALCDKEGLTKLDDFMGQSVSELNELLDEEIEQPEGEEGHRWFEPDTGIALIEALIEKIRFNPQIVTEPDAVISDFIEYKTVLVQAKAIKAQWHLAIDL